MIIDYQNKMSADQAVTSTAASTNIVDLGVAGDALTTHQLYLEILTKEAATAAGAATVNFALQTATDSGFSSPVTLFDSGAIAKTALTLKSMPVRLQLPIGCLRYIRVNYTVATGPLTAGKFDAFLTPAVDVLKG